MSLRLRVKRLFRSDLARAAATNLTLFGIATSILDGWRPKVEAGFVLVLTMPLSAFVVRWFRAGGQFPTSAFEDILPVRRHCCRIPADGIAINGACRLAERHFGSSNIRQAEIIGMYERNPFSLVTLRCDEKVVAYADFFILQPPYLEQLLEGTLEERSMTVSMTTEITDFPVIRSLYLGGIVVKEPQAGHGARRSAILLWASCKLLLAKYLMDDRPVVFYAEGFSPEGIALLEKLEFECIDSGEDRKSGDPLYSRSLCRADVIGWISARADWSSICELNIHES